MEAISIAAPLNNSKTIRAWCMYDWANSVYSLVIASAIFPVYYKAKAVSETGSDVINFLGFPILNSVLYSYALSFSFLVVALVLPLLSGMADYSGRKKFFMKIFVFIGSISCMGLYFFTGIDSLVWGIFCSVLASIGYSGSLVFYDAFLPEIVTEDRSYPLPDTICRLENSPLNLKPGACIAPFANNLASMYYSYSTHTVRIVLVPEMNKFYWLQTPLIRVTQC